MEKLKNWLKNKSRIALACVDLAVVSFSYYLAFYLRFDGVIPMGPWGAFMSTLPWVVGARVAILWIVGCYKGAWSYASIFDLVRLLAAVSLGSAAVSLTFAIKSPAFFPRSIIAIDWLLNMSFLGGLRYAPRIVAALRFAHRGATRRVLVVGAGNAGEMVLREMQKNPELNYNPVGLIDDDPSKQGMSIHGVPVLGQCQDIPEVSLSYNIDEIIIAIPSATGKQMREILGHCHRSRASIKTLPSLKELMEENVFLKQVRNLNLEDLLGRSQVQLNTGEIRSYLEGKRVLVTGAGGSIGSEICRQVAGFFPSRLVLFGRGEHSIYQVHRELASRDGSIPYVQVIGDVINKEKIARVIEVERPEIVFHAAADKHVPLMELNPDEAVLNNIIGTRNLLEACEKAGVERVVCISTDKAVNPRSVMGACKRVSEILVQAKKWGSTVAVAVRFGNVLGSRGSVLPLFQEQIMRGGPVTVTHPDMSRYFMSVAEAVGLVLQAGAMGRGGEIFVLDMGEPVRILKLAEDLVRIYGRRPYQDIPIRFVGLRPGEKLDEELAYPWERLESTEHEKIMVVNSGQGGEEGGDKGDDKGEAIYSRLEEEINLLQKYAIDMDTEAIHQKLQEILREFQPIGREK